MPGGPSKHLSCYARDALRRNWPEYYNY
jgi:hypothetical protein